MSVALLSSRVSLGADHSKTIVLLHDCIPKPVRPEEKREIYLKADRLCNLVDHSGERLCVYQRKPDTTDQDLFDLWLMVYQKQV
jgi:hypothetical protein